MQDSNISHPQAQSLELVARLVTEQTAFRRVFAFEGRPCCFEGADAGSAFAARRFHEAYGHWGTSELRIGPARLGILVAL